MSRLIGAPGSEVVIPSIKDKKTTLESHLASSFVKAHEQANPVLKHNPLCPKPGSQFQKLSLEKALAAVVPSKLPSAVCKLNLFVQRSKSPEDEASNSADPLKITPSSKMRSSVVTAEIQLGQSRKHFTKFSKDVDSESCNRQTNQPNKVALVSSPPKPPFTKNPSFTVQTTELTGKTSEPGTQGPMDNPSAVKKKPLSYTSLFANPPPKPNRPPRVNLEKFTVVKGFGNNNPQQRWGCSVIPHFSHGLHKMPPVTPSISSQAPARSAEPHGENSYNDVGVMDLAFLPDPADCPDMVYENQEIVMHQDREMLRPCASSITEPQALVRKPKGSHEVEDAKKQKNWEKEEKEFRKKFKFEGTIQVLYQVAVIPVLTCKKWGDKDLPLKPGTIIDVIVRPLDNKLIGRNQDGKFGYVSTSNIVPMNNKVYNDVTEGCIYEN